MHATIEYLRTLGHQYNPMIRHQFEGLEPEEWEQITPESHRGRELVRSYQMMMGEVHEELCSAIHHRPAHYDGEVGLATDALLHVSRCGCPDYLPASSATGSGSWRVGCLADYPDLHAVYYHLDRSRMPSQTADWWPEIEETVLGAYREIGLLLVETENKSQAQLHVSFEVLRGSTIGLAMLPPTSASARCERGFFCKLHPGYKPSAIQVSTLWAHEFGHNTGSGHIANDPVMGPVIQSGWNRSFKGTAFGRRLSTWFGGEPVHPKPQPPTGGGRMLTGRARDHSTGQDYDFILSAATRKN